MKRLIVVSLALTTGLMMFGVMAPAQAAVTQAVDNDGMASLTNCNAATPTHTTIQAGVDAAAAGDTVKVCPGTYTENVTVNKALTLNGPKAGVNGTRVVNAANEAIVHASDPNLPILLLEANAITVNGFLVEGNTNNAGIQTRPTASGYQILNNIVRDNVFGVLAARGWRRHHARSAEPTGQQQHAGGGVGRRDPLRPRSKGHHDPGEQLPEPHQHRDHLRQRRGRTGEHHRPEQPEPERQHVRRPLRRADRDGRRESDERQCRCGRLRLDDLRRR